MYRLVNDFGEPTLHDIDAFAVVSDSRPEYGFRSVRLTMFSMGQNALTSPDILRCGMIRTPLRE